MSPGQRLAVAFVIGLAITSTFMLGMLMALTALGAFDR